MNNPTSLDVVSWNSGLPAWFTQVDIAFFINATLKFVFPLAAILLLIYLISGGLQMMTSRGDPKAMQGAQGKITSALIGFIIVILAYYIVKLINQIFGIVIFE